MKLFGPSIEWSEPWSWDNVRHAIEANFKAFIPLWRLSLWCVALPNAAILAAIAVFLFVLQVDPDEPCIELLGRNLIMLPLMLFGAFIKGLGDSPLNARKVWGTVPSTPENDSAIVLHRRRMRSVTGPSCRLRRAGYTGQPFFLHGELATWAWYRPSRTFADTTRHDFDAHA